MVFAVSLPDHRDYGPVDLLGQNLERFNPLSLFPDQKGGEIGVPDDCLFNLLDAEIERRASRQPLLEESIEICF